MLFKNEFGLNIYRRNFVGQRTLVGLTFAEAKEFERLDAVPPLDEHGNVYSWPTEGRCLPPSENRWLQLYDKHRAACRLLDQNRTTKLEESKFPLKKVD
jgi:hypothetical protein